MISRSLFERMLYVKIRIVFVHNDGSAEAKHQSFQKKWCEK
ncbi:hypothetical protein B425_1540 [Bacillus amyloliquefaciens]|nr:hypothetical protein B425_1540 [Bacillus amyloliquefaciens]